VTVPADPNAVLALPIVEPVHGEVAVLGVGTPINGLTPALSISVAPSGIPPPLRIKFELVPGVDSGDAIPVELGFVVDVQPDAAAGEPVELNPPPSKVEFIPDIGVMAEALELEIAEELDPLVVQFKGDAGLRPPGSISVAPSGIPVGLFDAPDVLEPRAPSGDVAPMPPEVIAFCAWAAPQLNRTAANMRGKALMTLLRSCGSRPPSEAVSEEGETVRKETYSPVTGA
jgi:hypothetical protein